ncbi:PIN domain-containing protein [Flagellatimonas centrodinii]|uniref:PIN domain-containing protein n=1 Tax=Flagellatimonas centrodinii TaxID=2806210 RepID=UPI001FF88E1F|nr:PIN domain-containing protein [Flagellatimonas centrodinii]ULQ46450.1 PIN domain-containing protein [Flagellatimonas centrodinii]
MSYLLDAETLIGAVKGRLPVVLRLGGLKPDDVAVSVISRVEVEAALRSQPRINSRHGKLLKELLAAVRVIDFDAGCAQQAGTLGAYLQQSGEPLPPLDLLVAATALAHQATLVTPRTAQFSRVPQLELEHWC